MSRKRVERNIAYDDQKHLYYVTFRSPPNCDGPGKRRARTYRTYEAAAAALQQFQAGQAAGALPCRSVLHSDSGYSSGWMTLSRQIVLPVRFMAIRTSSAGICFQRSAMSGWIS